MMLSVAAVILLSLASETHGQLTKIRGSWQSAPGPRKVLHGSWVHAPVAHKRLPVVPRAEKKNVGRADDDPWKGLPIIPEDDDLEDEERGPESWNPKTGLNPPDPRIEVPPVEVIEAFLEYGNEEPPKIFEPETVAPWQTGAPPFWKPDPRFELIEKPGNKWFRATPRPNVSLYGEWIDLPEDVQKANWWPYLGFKPYHWSDPTPEEKERPILSVEEMEEQRQKEFEIILEDARKNWPAGKPFVTDDDYVFNISDPAELSLHMGFPVGAIKEGFWDDPDPFGLGPPIEEQIENWDKMKFLYPTFGPRIQKMGIPAVGHPDADYINEMYHTGPSARWNEPKDQYYGDTPRGTNEEVIAEWIAEAKADPKFEATYGFPPELMEQNPIHFYPLSEEEWGKRLDRWWEWTAEKIDKKKEEKARQKAADELAERAANTLPPYLQHMYQQQGGGGEPPAGVDLYTKVAFRVLSIPTVVSIGIFVSVAAYLAVFSSHPGLSNMGEDTEEPLAAW